MTSAPRRRPRAMVSGLKPPPSMPVGTRMPTLPGGPDGSGMCRLSGREEVVRDSIDEGGDAGRDAQPHRPRGQRAWRVHAQLCRADRDVVVVVVAEIGGTQDAGFGSPLDPGADLDVLRPDGDGPAWAVVTPLDGNAVAELRRDQDRTAVRPGADGAGQEVALADEFGDEPRAGPDGGAVLITAEF